MAIKDYARSEQSRDYRRAMNALSLMQYTDDNLCLVRYMCYDQPELTFQIEQEEERRAKLA